MRKMLVAMLAMVAAVPASADVVDRVQESVNNRVVYKHEAPGMDFWEPAKFTGDCEDIALRKRELLLKSGYAEDDLQLILFYHPTRHVGHIVLYIASEDRVLDLQKKVGPESLAAYKARTGMVRLCRATDLRQINLETGKRCTGPDKPRTVEEAEAIQAASD